MASLVLACPVLRPSLPSPRMGKGPSLSFPSSIGTSVRLARTAAPPKPCLPLAGRDDVGVGAVHPLSSSFNYLTLSLRRVGVGLAASQSQNPEGDDASPAAGTWNDDGSVVMFCCEICAKRKRKITCFPSTDQLWMHCKEEHPKDAIFRCGGCGNGFKNQGKLRRHRSRCQHAEEEGEVSDGPYCCEICYQREGNRECFRSADELWRHCREEHGEEAIVRCYGCGNGFLDKWHLRRHKRRCQHRYVRGKKFPKSHFRTYTCYVCGKWFKDKEKCRRHTRRCLRSSTRAELKEMESDF